MPLFFQISMWIEKVETEKLAAEELEKDRRANARRDAALAMLAGGAG